MTMLTTYLTEDEGADELRKARVAKQASLDAMKAALSTPAAGSRIAGDIIPFRKAQPSQPRDPQPRPPEREAAKLATSDMRKHRTAGLGDLLIKAIAENQEASHFNFGQLLRKQVW
jgi:hypothetical protein